MPKLQKSLLKCINKILHSKECADALVHKVFHVERIWSGDHIGDGKYRDFKTEIYPTPSIIDYSHNLMASQGGNIQSGDLLLQGISKANYDRKFLSPQTDSPNIERWFIIEDREYRAVSITEHLVTFNVLVRTKIAPTRGAR